MLKHLRPHTPLPPSEPGPPRLWLHVCSTRGQAVLNRKIEHIPSFVFTFPLPHVSYHPHVSSICMISIFTSSHFINFPPTLPYAYAANKSPLITVSLKFCYQITANIRGSSSLLSFSVVSDPFTISYSYTYPIGLLCHTVSWLCSLHVMPSQSHLLSLPHFSLFHFRNFCSPE